MVHWLLIWMLLLAFISYQKGAVTARESGGSHARCGSGKVNWPVHSSNMGATSRTKRQSPQPIRIVPYFVTAKISAEVLNILQAEDGTLAYTVNYFQRTLSVMPFEQNLLAPDNADMCGPHVAIPDDHKGPNGSGFANADYLYYVTAVNDVNCQGSIVAYAGPCYVELTMDNRPYIGFVNYCPGAFESSNIQYINVISIHEATHALVFSPDLFDRFPLYDNVLSQRRINGQDIITTPKVVQAARDHYNCSTLSGMLLENEGSELSRGFHWESRILFPDLMDAAIYENLANTTAISRITLSLFEDSGWYTVDYEAGLSNEELLLGSDEGCDFITVNCNSASYPLACTSCCQQKIECTNDYQAAGICDRYTFFENCPVLLPVRFCTDTSPIDTTFIPSGTTYILNSGPQSICVEDNNPDPSDVVVANCLVRQCFQIQGTELMAFTLTFSPFDQVVSIPDQIEWCYPDGTVNNGQFQCPPVRYACARGDITMLSPNDTIPPPLCDVTCASCTVAQNPAFCQSCVAGRMLNGNSPTSCVLANNPCNGSTYLSSSGECTACPTGCSLCNGPQNSECLACENADLYRDTTNTLSTACVTQCEGQTTPSVDVFGVRTCTGDIAQSGAVGTTVSVPNIVYVVLILIFSMVAIMKI